jgi:MerR family transcriptional regulator, thiopeptide resistance regulator
MSTTETTWSVGEAARLAGVTVRTLHHYDEIGLLSPSERSEAGYRLYSADDLGRLRDVLAYRELGFGLEEIAAILDGRDGDPLIHLRRQRELLAERIERLGTILAAVELEMEAHQMDVALTPEERLEVFGGFDPGQHAGEAERRWGDTGAYAQSQGRTRRYGKDDWKRIKAEAEDVEQRFAAALANGEPADGETAMELAEAHRTHIATWFYDCSPEMHATVTRMYVEDERFEAHYEAVAPGLAAYVHQAAVANAARRA